MERRLRVLIVEDNPRDADLLVRELTHAGYAVKHARVETRDAMADALRTGQWDLVIADYSLPAFSGPAALSELQATGRDLPFIMVSGTIGEDVAVGMLKAGAHDYLLKGKLARLGAAVDRELREVEARQQRRATEDALRASEERFRTLVESLDEVVFTLDKNLRYDGVYGGTRGSGWSADRMVGRTATEVWGDEEARPHAEAHLRALRGETVVYRCRVVSGLHTAWYEVSLVARRSGIGETLGLVGVARDVRREEDLHGRPLRSVVKEISAPLPTAPVAHTRPP